MQTSGNQSNKIINSILLDPFLGIFRQLNESNAGDGHYFRIIDKELRFYPIYKIASTADSNFNQNSEVMKKNVSQKENQRQSLAPQRNQLQQLMKMKFLYGSQIYLKTTKIFNEIEVIKPYFPNLYVWLLAKGKGYVRSKEDKIDYSQTMHTSNIWLCMTIEDEKQRGSDIKEVVFCNFDDNSYLFLDQSGIFLACSEERATRFVLNQVGNSTSFVLSGRNNLSMMVKNKSSQQIKKIIDKSIEKYGSKKSLQIEIEILPVEDSFITIQLEVNYIEKAILFRPSLSLINILFNELIYYGILDFSKDLSLINQHLQDILLQHKIFQDIAKYLVKSFKMEKRTKDELIPLKGYKKSSFAPSQLQRESERVDEPSIFDQSIFEIGQNQEIIDVMKIIGVLCRQQVEIALLYLPLLKILIQSQIYQLACLLIQQNQFFISHFYKEGWFEELNKNISRSTPRQISRIINFLCYFCSFQTSLSPTPSKFCYKQTPSTNNQYLLYHTINTTDLSSKFFVYELYNQGAYVFVHDSWTGKEVQFQTFMEDQSPPEQQSEIIGMQAQRPSSTSQQKQKKNLLISQINFIKSVTQNQNYNIIFHYWPIAYALAPYCYRQNFPTLSDCQAKKVILNLIYAVELNSSEKVAPSKYMITFIETQENENAFKHREDIASDLKPDLSQFMKNYRKKSQVSRKIYKEMGLYFLRKIKKLWQNLKQKKISMSEIFELSQQNNMKEWLNLMKVYLSMRLTKIKEKKEGQLLGYIKKIFENVEKEKKEEGEEQENLFTYFIEFLLEVLKFNSKYDRYLQHIKVKKNYESKFTNQINKVISNFQAKKEVPFARKKPEITKMELINIVYKNLQDNPKEPSQTLASIPLSKTAQNNIFAIKMLTAKLLQHILLNVHQEMIDESVETLTYLLKNPSDLSSLSSFGLLQMMPKFPLQSQIKQVVLESWYFASNTNLLNTLTSVLRILYQKKTIFRRNINDVYLFEERQLEPVFNSMLYPIKFINQMADNCQSWLRYSLLQKYSQIYETVNRYFQIIYLSLLKLREKDQNQLISHIMENLDLLNSITCFLEYFLPFYQEQQQRRAIDQRIYPIDSIVSENPFVEGKLNPLSKKIINILNVYMNTGHTIKMRETEIVLHSLGNLLCQMTFFNILIFKIFNNVGYLSKKDVKNLLNYFTAQMILFLFNNLPESWPFFDAYNYLQGHSLIVHIQTMTSLCFKKSEQQLFPIQELIFTSSSRGILPSEFQLLTQLELELPQYEYMHQIVFFKLVLKLISMNIFIDFVKEFRDKILWHVLHKHTIQKNQKNPEISQYQILRRRLLVCLAFQFKHNLSAPTTLSVVQQQDQIIEDANNHIINFIRYEIKASKENMIEHFDNQSMKFSTKGVIKDSQKIQYLEFIICDLLILSKDLGLLGDQEIFNFFKDCRKILKDQHKLRVIEKETDPSPSFMAKIDRILFYSEHEQQILKIRNIPIFQLPQERPEDSQKSQKSKPLRKWEKAVDEINDQKISSKHAYLLEDMVEYCSIYVFKSDSDNINLVVNHQDFFLKLLEISLHTERLILSTQNEIFLLEQIYIQVRQRLKDKKQRNIEIENYALRLIDSIAEEEQLLQSYRIDVWKNNIYSLIVKLQIIKKSRLFQRNNNKGLFSIKMINIFKRAIYNYHWDCAFLKLYKSTLNSKQENTLFQSLIPFEIVLDMAIQQVTPAFLDGQLLFELVRASYVITFGVDYQFRKYQQKDLRNISQSIEKDQLNQIIQELNESSYLNTLINIKN